MKHSYYLYLLFIECFNQSVHLYYCFRTMLADTQPDYQLFKEWFLSNGGLFHKIQFPVKFPPLDYIGVAAAQDIKANQTFLAVPKKLIISVTKVRDSALGPVLSSYKSLSDPDTEQTEFNILALYLIWQKMLGKVSFFYPYLQVVGKASTIMQWPDDDIRKLKDPYITVDLVDEMRQQFPPVYKQFHELSVAHPELFKEPITWQLFMDCYALVMTRCFGWGLPETMMVPFADFLNHTCSGVNHYAFNKKLEQSAVEYEQYKKQYVRKRKQIDLSLLGINNKSELPISYMRNARQKFIHENQKLLNPQQIIHPYNPFRRLSPNITRQHLQVIHKQLLPESYNVPLYPSSNSEDNDSEEEESQHNQKQRIFVKQLKRLSREGIEHRYEEPKPMANSQFQDDVTFSWWQQLAEDQTYFIMAAQRNIEKGEQVFNSYGRRSNRFLLIWYGFTHINNKYDSVTFRLFDKQSSLKSGKMVFVKFITDKDIQLEKEKYENLNITDQFRLKRDNLCFQLLTYLRLRIIRSTQPYIDLHRKKLIQIHKISNLQMEKLVLNSYLIILKQLQKQYFIEEERQKLSNVYHDYFAYILTSSNKQIISNHIIGTEMLIALIQRVTTGQNLLNAYQSQKWEEPAQKYGHQKSWHRRKFILDYVKMMGTFLDRNYKK